MAERLRAWKGRRPYQENRESRRRGIIAGMNRQLEAHRAGGKLSGAEASRGEPAADVWRRPPAAEGPCQYKQDVYICIYTK